MDIATIEIDKANDIICKQTQEIKKLQATTALRTQIVVHQEKAMKDREEELNQKAQEIDCLNKIVDNFRKEIPMQLHSMKILAEGLENKYGASESFSFPFVLKYLHLLIFRNQGTYESNRWLE